MRMCKYCGKTYNKKQAGVWTIKFPLWICHECAIKSNMAFSKMGKGKIKSGVKELFSIQFGTTNKSTNRKFRNTNKNLKGHEEEVRNKLKHKGFTDDEINEGWKKAGFKK